MATATNRNRNHEVAKSPSPGGRFRSSKRDIPFAGFWARAH